MAIPADALALITSSEGYLKRLPDDRAAPYLCPARVPTLGWGTTFYEGHVKVTLADPPITRDRARQLLAYELAECEAAVDRMLRRRLHPLCRGVLVSFVYNLGAGTLRASTLLRKVNAGEWRDVPAELAKFRMGGGVVLPGLVRRRAAEGALFMRGVREMAGEMANDDFVGAPDSAARCRPGAHAPGDGGWLTRVLKAA